ncbi:uncharacterized protein LOC114363147 [Ostrinia furnacalis]|uniref:uncharacterized protein LOC114363147 n=1 Tax=Ostrinia furnacalis TaxID=93504 RepID=UPI00103B0A16|nr:uncharacterized protein LOC114363147 [Ostrinia furnacalis]
MRLLSISSSISFLGTSRISFATSTLTSTEDAHIPESSNSPSSQTPKAEYVVKNHPLKNPFQWHFQNKERKLVFFNFQRRFNAVEKFSDPHHYNRSLCSMNCFTRLNINDVRVKNVSGSTNAEKQMHITDLESNSHNICTCAKKVKLIKKTETKDTKKKAYTDTTGPATTYYFFSRKKRNTANSLTEPPMKKSKKCTNLVKYKNMVDEPKLKEPLSKCLLLKKHRAKSPNKDINQLFHRGVGGDVIPKEHNQVQAVEDKEHKSLQDLMSVSEYDKITEHLMISLFENHKITRNSNNNEFKYYISQVVKELYNVKFSQTDVHPVKMLFRSLLEYWLKNTSGEQFKEAMKRVKSVHKPSNRHFTQDKILSSFLLQNATKQTQFHGVSDFINDYEVADQMPTKAPKSNLPKPKLEKKAIRCHSPKRDTESFEKERRIQELERILKNTVYVCETVRSNQSREKDIKITKRLIDNLEKLSKRSGLNNLNEGLDKSNSSSELPKIQETINHLISETSMPPDVAKELLNAYLSVLLNESSKSMTHSSSQSSDDKKCNKNVPPMCEVQTESVQRKISKNITTTNFGDNANQLSNTADPGEQYLKDILDKITTIFSKVGKGDPKNFDNNDKSTGDKNNVPKDELGRPVKEYHGKNLIRENYDENSVVIDLSKYDLEHISMFSDPSLKGMMSITIKLKEKPPNFGESQRQLSLKFCNESKNLTPQTHSDDWLQNLDNNSLKKIFEPIDVSYKQNLYDYDPNCPKDMIELKPYISSSNASSRPYCHIVHESEHSIDLSFQSSNFFKKDYPEDNEDTSCYIVSSFKKNTVSTPLQKKKKVHLKHSNGLVLGPQIRSPIQSSSTKYPEEYSVFEQPTPKVIDEKFILLLLENLTLLSKNLPSLYKDLNALFLKLKKKHEKVVRNGCNIQGLSLLGRIYNDDFKPNDRGTQFDEAEFNETMNNPPKIQEVSVKTSDILLTTKNLTDESISTTVLKNDIKTEEVQTEKVQETNEVKLKISISHIGFSKEHLGRKSKSLQNMPNQKVTTEQAVSCPVWPKKVSTKDCAMSTIIKTILDPPEPKFSIAPAKNFENVQLVTIERDFPKISNRNAVICVRKELVKGINALSPSVRVSTQSQTDKIILRHSKDVKANEYNACNEFKVYHVFLGAKEPLQKSNSMMDSLSVTREQSDDLKTIYRCNSEPSFCSG